MDVFVNGKAVETAARVLSDLIAEQTLPEAKVATAVNGNFVAQATRAVTLLQPGDKIEIVSPRQGG